MAHKKAGGSSRNGRDSNGQRLGVKIFGGEVVKAGNILVRQRGTKIHAGMNVGTGRDWTLFALIAGRVAYERLDKTRRKVSIYPVEAGKEFPTPPAMTPPPVLAKKAPKVSAAKASA